ncbi:MAG TPA: serpin family protein [Anaerolineaceae bacterium]
MKSVVKAFTMIMILALAACAAPTPQPTSKPPAPTQGLEPQKTPPPSPTVSLQSIKLAQSTRSRVTSPVVSEGELRTLVDGNTAFAFDLFQKLRSADGNLFFSPHSISVALAMTYAGAREATEKEMGQTLHYSLPQTRLHLAFNALDLALASREKTTPDGKGFKLRVVNSLWGQVDYNFLPEFLDVISMNYGAGLRLLNFQAAPDPSRQVINQWVEQQTEKKVKDLLPPDSIKPITRLVLVNAIYFNAAWYKPFTKESTREGAFTPLSGSVVNVPMMRKSDTLSYAEGTGYQVVELPYEGRKLSMVVILPAPGQYGQFESSLTGAKVSDIVNSLDRAQVNLVMPKFSTTSSFALAETLSAMGMPLAFNRNADFSGMDGTKKLMISDVFHKAFVNVDEDGTEAAAATAVVIVEKSAAPLLKTVNMTIDRPFIFLIRDIETGAILFVGRIVNPA